MQGCRSGAGGQTRPVTCEARVELGSALEELGIVKPENKSLKEQLQVRWESQIYSTLACSPASDLF